MKQIMYLVLIALAVLLLASCTGNIRPKEEPETVIINGEDIPRGPGSISVRYVRVREDSGQYGPFVNEMVFDAETHALSNGSCRIENVTVGAHVLVLRYVENEKILAEKNFYLTMIGGEEAVIDGSIPRLDAEK